MKAMILAAGFGKRMLPLTANTPKPLLKVNGQALIEYHLQRLAGMGITQVVINHAYLGQQIEAYLGDGSRYGLSIAYSPEPEPLETAGGIYQALGKLGDEPFLLMNGDVWTDIDCAALISEPLTSMGRLLLVENPSFHPQGDFSIDAEGYLCAAAEKTYTYSGIALLSPQLFAHYGVTQGPLAPLLRLALADKQLSAQTQAGQWFDVGTPQRLQEVEDFIIAQH